MQSFYYGVYIPSLKEKVYFKEINIQQLKTLVKTIINKDNYSLYTLFNEIIDASIKGDKRYDFTIIDRLMILLSMRSISIGQKQKIEITCTETQKTYEATIDYNQIIDQLEKIDLDANVTVSITPQFSLEYGLPLAQYTDNNISGNQLFKCIRRFKINNLERSFREFEIYELNQVIENSPKNLGVEMEKYLKRQEEKLSKVKIIGVLNPYTKKPFFQTLSMDEESLTQLLTLAFNEDLHSIYKGIYYMTTILKFSSEYVENITWNERQVYWAYYLADEKEKAERENNNNKSSGPPMRSAMDSFT